VGILKRVLTRLFSFFVGFTSSYVGKDAKSLESDNAIVRRVNVFRSLVTKLINENKMSRLDNYFNTALIIANILGFKEMWRDFSLMVCMCKDYFQGEYKVLPATTVISLTAVVVYVVVTIPLDIEPELGLTLDSIVVNFTVKSFKSDLADYKNWLERNPRRLTDVKQLCSVGC
jgi:uncharacterized membrane protein YkvA (DUF1232 family)